MIKKIVNKKGVTLIELLIAVSMASVVFMIVGSLLATFVTQNTRSYRQEMFEQVKNDLSMELANAIKWGQEVTISGNVILVDGVEYKQETGRILKNGQSLMLDNVSIKRFEVINRSTNPEIVGADITIELEDKNYPIASDVMHLVVSQRLTEITF